MFKNFLFIFGLIQLIPSLLFSQTKIVKEQLKNPAKYGVKVASGFNHKIVFEYTPSAGKHALFLKNGLRSSTFINRGDWLKIKDSVFPYQVDIVYSRYPLKNGEYHEFYKLLFNRLISLFALDPSLNDNELTWFTIQQSHCENDDQVNSLFHGIVIWYRTPKEELVLHLPDSEMNDKDAKNENKKIIEKEKEQGDYGDLVENIEAIKNSDAITDSLKDVLKSKPVSEQNKILKEHFGKVIQTKSLIKLNERTPEEMSLYKRQVDLFLKNNPFGDSVVWKVFDRHPEWVDVAVVTDWTGSMYGYGAQVIHWHLQNYKKSPIRFLTLFNDGDGKMSHQKKIGETGGIYSAESSDIPQIINLFNLVKIKGGGGDRPENDIEAILETQKRFPNASELILIADNYACIRDIELATQIKKPLRVVICGYQNGFGFNPHLVYLARITNGGLYTLEDDIENLKVETSLKGEIKSIKDKRIGLSMLNCQNIYTYDVKVKKEDIPVFTNLDIALKQPLKVEKLNLKDQTFTKVPLTILKLENLFYLNLSNNALTQLPGSIKKLDHLTELDISLNQIKKLPKQLMENKFLEYLNMSNNLIEIISPFFDHFFYMKVLDVSNNKVRDLNGLNQLKNVITLNLAANEIEIIPNNISQLKKLKILDLSANQIKLLPKAFIGLTKLEELNLENNELTVLPKYLYRLRKLKSLNLSGNPVLEEELERIRRELPDVQLIF
ncbi:MAG: leucine-rich repeat domain-containing protein [Bacteroidia bacterium]|nr:leucine-rich repeat domain-containing protein [Bacteroidia bacterium]